MLVKYRKDPGQEGPPLAKDEIVRIVVGGVERLTAKHVEVVLTPAKDASGELKDPDFQQVGPVSVAPRSKMALQGVIGLMGLIIVVLGSGIVFLLWKRMSDDES